MNHTITTQTPTRSRKRLIVPLAGMLIAAAITVGSGADFVAESVNTGNAFSTGTLTHSNSKSGSAIFNAADLKPGDTVTGTVTITNSGSLPADFTLSEDAVNGFTTKANLSLVITRTGEPTPVWSGTFGELTASGPLGLGTFAAGEARDYVFTTTLAEAATNAEQGRSATATYTWNSTQTAAETIAQ